MTRAKLAKGITVGGLLVAVAGCASETEKAASVAQGLEGATYFYMRCNSTGWGAGESTRMQSTDVAGVYEIEFEVTEPWMVTSGDACILTETPVEDGWGSWNRHYGVPGLSLDVPSTKTVFQYSPWWAPNFRVHYPDLGSFRATYNSNRGELTFESTAAQSGDVVWSADGALVIDSDGNAYLDNGDDEISRIDLHTGKPLWTRSGASDYFFLLDEECASATEVVGVATDGDARLLVGVDPESGATLWENDLNGDAEGSSVNLRCGEAASYVILRWGEETAVVSRDDGAVRWRSSDPDIGAVVLMNEDRVVYRHKESGVSLTLSGYSSLDGSVTWTRTYSDNTLVSESWGELYVVPEMQEVLRVDPSDGTVLWTYQNTGVGIEFIFDGLYARQRNVDTLTRLDRETGAASWSYSYGDPNADSVYARVLADEKIYVTSHDSQGTVVQKVDPATSQIVWSVLRAESPSHLQMAGEELYLFAGNTTVRLDSNTGTELWTSTLQEAYASTEKIVGTGPDNIYVRYRSPGSIVWPGGVVMLDRETGIEEWDYYSDPFTGAVYEDEIHLYVENYPRYQISAVAK